MVRCVYSSTRECVRRCGVLRVCACVCVYLRGVFVRVCVTEYIVMFFFIVHAHCVRACMRACVRTSIYYYFFFQGFIIKPPRHNGERKLVGTFGRASEPQVNHKNGLA